MNNRNSQFDNTKGNNVSKVSFKILTQKEKGTCHRETELVIDWTGITESELKVLARNALVHDFQAAAVKSSKPIPEFQLIVAKDMIHVPSPALLKYSPPPPKVDATLERLVAALSPEERAVLFASI